MADPQEVTRDKTGMLRNKEGVAVAMRGDAHSSRSVAPDEERAKVKPTQDRDMKPGRSKKYETR